MEEMNQVLNEEIVEEGVEAIINEAGKNNLLKYGIYGGIALTTVTGCYFGYKKIIKPKINKIKEKIAEAKNEEACNDEETE